MEGVMGQAIQRKQATVLVVEDEPLIQMMTADALDDAGFAVLEAWNADEALRVLEKRGHEVQLMLTDVNMPGSIDGLALADRVHARWPEILILVTSGQVRPCADELPAKGRFLPKPYRTAAMLDQINDLMHAGHA
jgi:CheY-like chemotaxis protein